MEKISNLVSMQHIISKDIEKNLKQSKDSKFLNK